MMAGSETGNGQIADRYAVLYLKSCQQGPPGRIGKRGKHTIERSIHILNHVV